MESGGALLLRTAVVDDLAIEIQIADTGTGIPEDLLETIFEPFFTTGKEGKGTGLGLFVTRAIVERLGGRIAVQSALGEGTTFAITLPLS
jgi:two-component system NtrC family sensor kinase